MKKMFKRFFRNKKALIIAAIIILAAAAVVVFLCTKDGNQGKKLSSEQAKVKAEEFVNSYLMPSGSKATISNTIEEYGLYKMTIDIGSESPVESYVTKDGRLFFPQAINMEETAAQMEAAGSGSKTAETAVEVPKSDKPVVELFVMSYCPYGTQIEKGMLSVLKTLGDKIDFKLQFCDYAMHDKKELDENLVQYCVQKEQPEKLTDYLQCFLDDGDSAGCVNKTTNAKKINACVAATDKEFKVTENYNNKTDWSGDYPGFAVNKTENEKYSVSGSPTLIINGQSISSDRSSSALLATICSAFNEAPKECQTKLNTQSPTAGFGFDYSAASTDASCN